MPAHPETGYNSSEYELRKKSRRLRRRKELSMPPLTNIFISSDAFWQKNIFSVYDTFCPWTIAVSIRSHSSTSCVLSHIGHSSKSTFRIRTSPSLLLYSISLFSSHLQKSKQFSRRNRLRHLCHIFRIHSHD